MFNHELEWYIRQPKCECDTKANPIKFAKKFYWDKARNFRTFKSKREDETCSCCGYPHPHQPKAKLCLQHPEVEFNTRVHRGENAEDVRLDIAFKSEPGPIDPSDSTIPF